VVALAAKYGFPNIQVVNTKSKLKPFIVVPDDPVEENWPFGGRVDGPMVVPYTGHMLPDVATFTLWSHWPVAQIPSDARLCYRRLG